MPNPYEKYIQDATGARLPYVNLCMETLRLLKESAHFGYDRIMVIEDDIAFLKNLSDVKAVLDDMPEGHDIIQMDKAISKSNKWKWDENVRERTLNEHFVSSPYNFSYATCNIYTKAGVLAAIDSLEQKIVAPDRITKFSQISTAIAIKNLAVQVLYDNACNLIYGAPEKLLELYTIYGLDLNNYAVPDGYIGKSVAGK